MLRLRAELTILAAPADLRGDDGAEFHIPAHEADANLVGPVEQIVNVIRPIWTQTDAHERFCIATIEQFSIQHALGQLGNVWLQNESPITAVRESLH